MPLEGEAVSQPKTFPASHDATVLADAIRRGVTTARAAAEACISAVSGDRFGAIRRFEPDLLLSQAESIDKDLRSPSPRFASAPFIGVPFLMKDLGNAAVGLPPIAGSRALLARPGVPGTDSDLALRFKAAGLMAWRMKAPACLGLSHPLRIDAGKS